MALLAGVTLSAGCTQAQLTKCDSDIQKSYLECDKAAKEKGADQIADLMCVKFMQGVERDCWPCICRVAKDNNWHIKGCDTQ